MGVTRFLETQEERQEFLEWISDVDCRAVHEEISSKRYEDTGSWLLENGIFKRWLHGHCSQVLWLNGRVGTGKSVLASVAINHLSQSDNFSKDAIVYAYLGEETTNAQYDAVQVMSSLVKQLCWKLRALPDPAAELYREFRLHARFPTFSDLKTLFFECSKSFEHVFIVFDGLDACQGKCRKEILKLVWEFADKSDNLKILVASRRDLDILHAFRNRSVHHIRSTSFLVRKDIERLVQHRVTTELGHIDPELQEYVIRTVTKSSKDTYMFAELQLNDLPRILEPDVKRHLESNPCPIELEDIYRSIFRKMSALPKVTRTLVQDCFLWTFNSKTVLASGAFTDAVSLEHKASTKRQSSYDAETLNDITFGLLDVSNLSMISVKPIHSSLQTFIAHPRTHHPSELQGFFPDRETADSRMAILCLRHLMLDVAPSEDIWDTCLFYCARYFDSHIRSLSKIPEELRTMLDHVILEKPEVHLKRILAWRFPSHEHYYPNLTCIGNPKTVTPDIFMKCTGLYEIPEIAACYTIGNPEWKIWPEDCFFLAAAVGLRDVLESFISDGVNINKTVDRNTALHCAIKGLSACYFTDTDIIKLLLDAGADWNFDARDISSDIPPEYYETPLNTALSHYVDSAVEVIVRHKSFNFAKAMELVPKEHPDWIRVLVKHGANIKQKDETGNTALEIAKLQERQECVRILQELGASG